MVIPVVMALFFLGSCGGETSKNAEDLEVRHCMAAAAHLTKDIGEITIIQAK
ncbi:MAG: hypothetical protein HQL36_11595, partial [Alphaproteobacteria bacterium]|nr:hypothetical protein [Alphaproteobacteria bacterium]